MGNKLNKREVSKIAKLVIVLAVSIAMALTPICAYAAPTQQTATVDAIAVNNAIANKDYKYIISVFFQYYGNYFRQHHQEANFPYFNATEYMKKYPDVAAACNNDPNKALEHYMAHGAAEGRSGCGKYDIVKFLKKYPETVLSTEFLNNVNTPEVYFAAIQPKVEEANSSSGTLLSGGGGGGGSSSGGGRPYTPTPRKKTVTFMYYCCGSNLETDSGLMSGSAIDSMLAAYGSDNVNLLMCFGGADKWPDGYLGGLLNYQEGDEENRTGYFSVRIDKMNAAIEAVANDFHWSVDKLYEYLQKEGPASEALYKDLQEKLFTDKVLELVEDKIYTDRPMYSENTLKDLLKEGKVNHSADEYVLVFNSHGGGATGGVGSYDRTSEKATDTSLDINEIGNVLTAQGYTDDDKLAFVAFDACLMGSIEIAAAIKDNYSYLYASEASQIGNIDYYEMVSTAANSGTIDDLGYAMAYAIFESRYKGNSGEANIQTSALFDSEGAQKAENAVNLWATSMLKFIGKGSGDNNPYKKVIYEAMRRATVRSYQITADTARNNYAFYDTRDYLEKLKAALHEYDLYNGECDSAIDEAAAAIQDFIIQNCYCYDGKYIYNSADGGIVEANRKFWEKYLSCNLGGGTIVVPEYSYIGAPEASGDTPEEISENDQAYIKDRRDAIKKFYCDRYKTLALGNYLTLVNEYTEYFTSEKEYARVRALAQQLLSNNLGVSGYEKLADVKWNDESHEAISIKVTNYTDTTPVNSSGDAFLDIIDTMSSFKVYLTRKLDYKNTSGSTDTVDMIIGAYDVPYANIDAVNNSVKVLTRHILNGTTVTTVSGILVDPTSKQYLNNIFEGDTNSASNKKDLILMTTGINSELDALSAEIDQLYSDREKETDKQKRDAITEKIIKKEKERSDKCDELAYNDKLYEKVIIYDGFIDTADGANKVKSLLLFVKNSDDTYTFKDSYKVVAGDLATDPDTYTLISNPKYVYLGHSFINSEDSDYDISHINTIEHELSGYKSSYYEEDDDTKYASHENDFWYKVADYDDSGEVTTKYELSVKQTVASKLDKDAENYGYYMGVVTYDGKTVVFNGTTTEDPSKERALAGNTYGSLIIDKSDNPVEPQQEQQNERQDSPKSETKAANQTETVTTQDTVMLETPITGAPEIIPVQAVIDDKVATDASSDTSDEAA